MNMGSRARDNVSWYNNRKANEGEEATVKAKSNGNKQQFHKLHRYNMEFLCMLNFIV